MELHLRPPMTEADLLRIVEFMNMVGPEPISMDTFHERQRLAVPGRIGHALLALDEQEDVVGYISIVSFCPQVGRKLSLHQQRLHQCSDACRQPQTGLPI